MMKKVLPGGALVALGVVAATGAALDSRPTPGVDPGIACAIFAPGTPPEVVERVTAMLAPTGRYSIGSAWFGGDGVAGTLRYSFAPDGLNIPSGVGEGSGSNDIHARLDALFASHGGRDAWKGLFRDVFDRWSEITGIEYVEVSDDGASWGSSGNSNRGDIRIAMKNIDGGSGVLAYNSFPTNGDMVLDRSENWASGSSSNFRFFRNTISHEHGHGIGMFHICPVNQTKLMEPFLTTAFDGPRHDDIRGAQQHYGDRFEPNGSPGAAAELGDLEHDVALAVEEISLRNDDDVDVYAIDLPPNTRLTVTATPVGQIYNQATQSGGSCPSGSSFNSLTLLDIELSLLGPDQSTIESADLTDAGLPEVIIDEDLAAGGRHYVRVSGSGSATSQIYRLDIAGVAFSTGASCAEDLTGDGQVGADDLAAMLGAWGAGSGPADLDNDGTVGASDLAAMLGAWGTCS